MIKVSQVRLTKAVFTVDAGHFWIDHWKWLGSGVGGTGWYCCGVLAWLGLDDAGAAANST